MEAKRDGDWTLLLPEEERAKMISEIVEMVSQCEKQGDFAPLITCIAEWEVRAGYYGAFSASGSEAMSEEAAMELALEAQRAARQEKM